MQLKLNNQALLVLLWALLTIVNLNKAVHVDDAFHLYAAQHIAENPLDPHSGWINWGDDPTQMYTGNQPPLFYYLLALVSKPFGMNMIPLHLMLSFFSFLALLYFQKILDYLNVQRKQSMLVLFALCPAFVVNQNLMVDIPILSLMMGMAYFLLVAGKSKNTRDYIKAAVLLGIGLLIKYSLMPLVIVLLIILLVRREYKNLLVLLIPIGMVSLWSLWTYVEFDSFHVYARKQGGIHIAKFWGYLSCLGSIACFAIPFYFILPSDKAAKGLIIALISSFLVIFSMFTLDFMSYEECSKFLNVLFIVHGSIIFLIICSLVVREVFRNMSEFMKTPDSLFFLFLSSIGLFIVLFVPFMATRHVLLAIPFILLLARNLIDTAPKAFVILAIVFSFLLSLILGISDWHYAQYYKTMAKEAVLPIESKVWSIGHWGWHWYSEVEGADIYSTQHSETKKGDYIIYAENTPKQELAEGLKLELVDKKWKEATLWTYFSVSNGASLYNSSDKTPAWTLSKHPMDTIVIMRVME